MSTWVNPVIRIYLSYGILPPLSLKSRWALGLLPKSLLGLVVGSCPSPLLEAAFPAMTEKVTAMELEGFFDPKLVVCFGLGLFFSSMSVLYKSCSW